MGYPTWGIWLVICNILCNIFIIKKDKFKEAIEGLVKSGKAQ